MAERIGRARAGRARARARRRQLLLPVLGALGAGAALHLADRLRRRPGSPYLAGAPLLIAHRGGAGLAPENTLLAFERAIRWWEADVLELDVQPTQDGEAVVVHDATLERTTDGRGPVATHTLAQLAELDAGFRFTPDRGESFPFRGRGLRIPTLAEVLARFPWTRINIEIKDGRAQERVRESIEAAGACGRVLIAAGRRRDRVRLRTLPVPISASEQEIRFFVARSRLGLALYTPAVDALQLPDQWQGERIVTPSLIRAAHARNLPVHVWTVDARAEMEQLLDWGVDGIVTDRPDRLARVLHERCGRPLPPGPAAGEGELFLERLLRA